MIARSDLEAIGLNGKQAGVYLALLELGSGTAAEIAVRSGLKRPTVYDIVGELETRHLIRVDTRRGRRTYAPRDPEHLLREQQKRLARIQDMLPRLNELYRQSPGRPRVRLYDGTDGLERLHDELLNTSSGEYHYFDSGVRMVQALGVRFLERYVRERVARGIRSNAIRAKNAEVSIPSLEGSESNLRRVRLLPITLPEDTVSLYVYDDTVGIISSHHEHYFLAIESEELARFVRTLWHVAWHAGEEPPSL